MASRITAASPIVISATDADRKVLVSAEEQDRFMLAVPEAIAACRFYEHLKSKRAEFWDQLVPALMQWLDGHGDRISGAYLVPRESGLLFIAVCADVFDVGLQDELTDLDMEIARRFPDVPLEVLELPEGEEHLTAFIDPAAAPLKFEMAQAS